MTRLSVLFLVAIVAIALPALVLSRTMEFIPFQFQDIRNSGTNLMLSDDQAVSVPFPFNFFVFLNSYPAGSPIWISSNGLVAFVNSGAASFVPSAPNFNSPNAVYAPFWADLNPSAGGFVNYQTIGSAPHREFIVQWTNVPYFGGSAPGNTFQVVLREDEQSCARFNYVFIEDPMTRSTFIGIESPNGADAFSYQTLSFPIVNRSIRLCWISPSGNFTTDEGDSAHYVPEGEKYIPGAEY